MKKFLAVAVLALSLAVFSSAPASAGNGTSNFYLTGSCWTKGSYGNKLSISNYDTGSNQTYHIAVSKSGVAFTGGWKVYIGGYYVAGGSGAKAPYEDFITMAGHGPNTLKIVDSYGSSCSFVR